MSCCWRLLLDKQVVVILLVALEVYNLWIEARNCRGRQSIGYRNSAGLKRTLIANLPDSSTDNERTNCISDVKTEFNRDRDRPVIALAIYYFWYYYYFSVLTKDEPRLFMSQVAQYNRETWPPLSLYSYPTWPRFCLFFACFFRFNHSVESCVETTRSKSQQVGVKYHEKTNIVTN